MDQLRSSYPQRTLIVVRRVLTAPNVTLADASPEESFARSRTLIATFNEKAQAVGVGEYCAPSGERIARFFFA